MNEPTDQQVKAVADSVWGGSAVEASQNQPDDPQRAEGYWLITMSGRRWVSPEEAAGAGEPSKAEIDRAADSIWGQSSE
jgi:hypothetical protein